MKRTFASVVALVALGAIVQPAYAQTPDVVQVAPPTGEREADRASILAALEQVPPGGTVHFASGTYLIGEIISITIPEVTLVGHPDGTTLRGCEWEDFQDMDPSMLACNGLELAGVRQTVRGITFENAFWGLHLGCCWSERRMYEWTDGSSFEGPVFRRTKGGHLVENNTFRSAGSGLRVNGDWTEPAVVRNNRFIDNWHAVSINGHTVHLRNNHISVPEPERVPFFGFPWDGIKISPPPPAWGEEGVPSHCTGNVIEGNHVEGHLDGIRIEVYFPGTFCRDNIVRDNTVVVRRVTNPLRVPGFVLLDESDSTFVGVPISILNDPMAFGEAGPGNESVIEGNVIERNRIVGGEGVGIQVLHASRNRIADNEIIGISHRTPFPGNSMGTWGAKGLPPPWQSANGAGIWLSPGSDENEIVGNVFEDVAGTTIVLEGDRNRVEVLHASDSVRDLGSANRVISRALPPQTTDTLETGRLIFHQLLHPVGEEIYTITREGETRVLRARFTHNDRGRVSERSAELRFGVRPEPVVFHLRETIAMDMTDVAVEANGGQVTLTDATGSRQMPAPNGYFTASGFAPHSVQAMLVRYWRESGQPESIPLLPRGHASVQLVGRDTLIVGGEEAVLDRYHVRGHWWGGQTLWLDRGDRLVAAVTFDFNYQAIREGYEDAVAFFSDRGRRDVLARAEAANRLRQPLHAGTFALVGGVLIDGTGAPPLTDATVVVRDGRIAAVGPRAEVAIPEDATVVDLFGKTVLPGLWDMHAHLGGIVDFGPIYLAAGVTTVRDLGNEPDWLLALREAFATGRVAGPRLLMAAEIDGKVPEAVGAIQADTPEEARALVRHFHELGFEQIKLYNRLMPELVPVIAEEAHRLGMTVTGHVPWGMSLIDAVQAGVDHINHLDAVMQPMLPDSLLATGDFSRITAAFLSLDAESAELRHLIDTLLQHGTVLDLTLAAFENWWRPASVPVRDIEPGAALMPPELVAMMEGGGLPAGEAADRAAIFRKALEIVGMMHRAGVPIVAGTDVVVPGHSLHRELELYVEAGLSPLEAIRAATAVPAGAMGLEHEVGTVEAGKRADLIIVDGDPLSDIREIRNVQGVVTNGRLFDTAALWRSVGFETRYQP